MGLSQVPAGLATRLRTITTLANTTYDYVPALQNMPNEFAYVGYPTVPGFEGRKALELDELGPGVHRAHFPVIVGVTGSSSEVRWDALAPYLDKSGSKSVTAAIDAEPTLGGACHYARVLHLAEVEDLGGFLGALWFVEVVYS